MDIIGLARALSAQLKKRNVLFSHSGILELIAHTAGHKDWNVLSALAKKQGTTVNTELGLFCPKCGKQGHVITKTTAFVEQGPSVKNEYLFEGNADHYTCGNCEYQFLDWQSDWPSYNSDEDLIIVAYRDSRYAEYLAYLYPVGVVQAMLAIHGSPSVSMYAEAGSKAELVDILREQARNGETCKALGEFLDGHAVDSVFGRVFGKSYDAVLATLMAKVPSSQVEMVLNRN